MKRILLFTCALSLLLAASTLSAYPAYVKKLPVLKSHDSSSDPRPFMDSGTLQSGSYLTSIGKSGWSSSMLYGQATPHPVMLISITYPSPISPTSTTINFTFQRGAGGGYMGDFFMFYIRKVDPTDAAKLAAKTISASIYESMKDHPLSYDRNSTNPNPWVLLTTVSGDPCIASYGGFKYDLDAYKYFQTPLGLVVPQANYDASVASASRDAMRPFFSTGGFPPPQIPAIPLASLGALQPKGSQAYIAGWTQIINGFTSQVKRTSYTESVRTGHDSNGHPVYTDVTYYWPPAFPSNKLNGIIPTGTTTTSAKAKATVSGSFAFDPALLEAGAQYELIAESSNYQDTNDGKAGAIGWQKLGLIGVPAVPTSKNITVSAQAVPQDEYKFWFNSSEVISTTVKVP